MAFVTAGDGARIHYDVVGSSGGDPIVLIMGLGWDMSGWDSMMPHLSGHRVLRIDNRGAGLSDAPDRRYSIPLMASDVIAAMDDAGFASAHIYGASLGSMVAQELALAHPGRVRSLILGCPSPGVVSVPGSPGILMLLLRRGSMTREDAARRAAPYLVHKPESRAALIERARLAPPINPIGYRRQLQASMRWSSIGRLSRLRLPALIVHGDHDRLIPLANGRLISRLIPGARLHVIRSAGHVYSIDAPGDAAHAVTSFLEAGAATYIS